MKKNVLFLVLCFFNINVFAQIQKFPSGVYLSLEQLISRTPSFEANFQVIKRTQGDIGFNGGNDYELKSGIDSLNKKYIKKIVFAYVKNDSLFLNCIHHKLSTWYALCLTQGNFLAFKGAMADDKATGEVASYGVLFGAIGGGIAGASAAKKRFLYVLSLRTGNVRPLNKNYVVGRLKENQNLLDQYNIEKDPEAETTLIKYIGLLNEVLPVNPTSPPIQQENK